jgi:menaquinone-9 beta-reductase
MLQRTDVFVIGGGPAGLAAAIAARKKGLHVTVADGAHPPIDKACGEGLMPDTLAALRELGVDVSASEGYAVCGIRFLGAEREVVAKFPADLGIGIGMRRPVLHAKLVQAAEACGVELLWKTPVQGIGAEGVVVAGRVIAAKWIVGADGIGSRVRRWSGLDTSSKYERRYAFRRHYRVRPWSEFMEVHWGENAQAYVTPVQADEVCVVLISRRPGMRLVSLREEFPQLARRLGSDADAGSERGATTMMRRLKHVYRGNVALIGDASGGVDAITGEGLCLSFRQAAVLADALDAGDLRQYQTAHRRLARRPTFMGRIMLLLDGHTAVRERVMRALSSQPDVFARLLAVHVGATSPAHFAATGALLGWRLVAT